MTLFEKIQNEIALIEARAGADLSGLEAKIKALFQQHAVATPPVPDNAPPAVAVAAVLATPETKPIAP